MSILAEVAPVQERSTVCLPCTLRPCALSVIEPGVGVGVGVTVGVGVGVGVDVGVGVGVGVGGGPDCAQYLLPVFNRFPSISTPPNDHFAAGPDGCVRESSIGRVSAGGCPSVGAGVISAAGVKGAEVVSSAPDDHFTTCPNCCVRISRGRCVRSACGCPASVPGLYFPPVFKLLMP